MRPHKQICNLYHNETYPTPTLSINEKKIL